MKYINPVEYFSCIELNIFRFFFVIFVIFFYNKTMLYLSLVFYISQFKSSYGLFS